MRKRSYVKAASRSSSYYRERERRGNKASTVIFSLIALIAIGVAIFMFLRYQEIGLLREEAAAKLAGMKIDTESLNEERKSKNTQLENLFSELEKLRIEYDSLSE